MFTWLRFSVWMWILSGTTGVQSKLSPLCCKRVRTSVAFVRRSVCVGGVPQSRGGLSTEPVTQSCGSSFSPHSFKRHSTHHCVTAAQAGITAVDPKCVRTCTVCVCVCVKLNSTKSHCCYTVGFKLSLQVLTWFGDINFDYSWCQSGFFLCKYKNPEIFFYLHNTQEVKLIFCLTKLYHNQEISPLYGGSN